MGKSSREKRERRLGEKAEPKGEKPEIGFEKILKTIILGGTVLILFTPLILSSKFFFPFVGPKSLYFMGLTEIVFFSWLFLIIFYPKCRPRLNFILLSLILFTAILILASLFGVDPSYSFWSKFERMTGILMMLHLLAFFLVVSSVFREKDWLKIFSVSIFVGVILSLIALFSKSTLMQSGATIGNDSFLGTYLLFDLFLALYLITRARQSRAKGEDEAIASSPLKSKGALRIYSSVCFLIMGFALIFSEAEAAKLSFLGGLVLLLFLWLAFNQKRKLMLIGRLLLALSVIFVIVFTFFAFQPDSFVRKQIIEKTLGETFGGRFIVWQAAWQGFLERPLLGWGLESFEFAFIKHYDPCLGTARCGGDVWYDRAHNIIFDTLITSGIIGFLSYLTIFGVAFWILWKQYYRKAIDFLTAGIFSSILVAYSVQNLTVFDMVSSYMIFFLTLGFIGFISSENYGPKTGVDEAVASSPPFAVARVVDELRSSSPTESRLRDEGGKEREALFDFAKSFLSSRFARQLTALILFILLVFSLFEFVIKPLKTDFYVIKSLRAQNSKEKILLYKKTLSFSSVGRYQVAEQLADLTLTARSGLGKTVSPEDYKAELDFISEKLEKSIKQSPLNLRGYLKLGQIYNAYVRIDPQKLSQAEMVLRRAIEISPKNQQIYWELIQTKLYQGEFNEAFSLAEKSLELEPERGQSHLIVIQVAKIMGDDELANKKAKDAIRINPSWEPKIKEIIGN